MSLFYSRIAIQELGLGNSLYYIVKSQLFLMNPIYQCFESTFTLHPVNLFSFLLLASLSLAFLLESTICGY